MITRAVGDVAWCCSHYPNQCRVYGWTDTEPQATMLALAHWRVVHRGR